MMPSSGGAGPGPGGPEGQHGCLFLRSGVVLLFPQALVPSSTGTTPSGSNASSGGSAWCFSPRKPLSLRRRAPRPQAQTRVPPTRRGASLPANPCPFVGGHHAPRLKREFRRSGVVLPSPQILVLSSTGTTPPGPKASSSGSAWCFSPRKPLFFRRRAPRPQARTDLPPTRRGASLPANPCSFVDEHHAHGLKREFLRLGVVLLSPQALVLSSTGTTPSGSNASSSGSAWCFSPRKPLSLRRRAPRPQAQTRVPPTRRGASLPANPCPFVGGHHAPRPKREFRRLGVVLLSPQALVPSSTGTTPSGSNASSGGSAWCFSPRKPLSLRRRAPRPQARTDLPRASRT